MIPSETSPAQACAARHREAQARLHRVADGLGDTSFGWRPAPGAWSVADCIEHLDRVAGAYLPRLEAAVAAGAPRATGPFAYGFVARTLIRGAGPDGPALTTGAALDPSAQPSPADRRKALAALDRHTDRYVAVCEQADGLDLARIRVRYPFMRLLRLPLGAVLEVTGLHALRHARQAERIAARSEAS